MKGGQIGREDWSVHAKYTKNDNLVLNCAHKICIYIKNKFGAHEALLNYDMLYDKFESNLGSNRYENIYYLNFLDGYTENLLHMNSKKALTIYCKELAELEKSPSLNPNIIGKVYNRIYVYYKDKMPEEMCHRFLERSLKFCHDYNLKELEMLNYFDEGSYNLYQKFDKESIITIWEKAFDIYEKEKFDDAFLFISKKRIQLHLLSKQYDLAKQQLKSARSYLEIHEETLQQSLFFYKSLSVLYIIYLLLEEPDFIELPRHLSMTLEYYNKMDNSAIYNVYFLYAKYYYFQKDYENMLLYYNLCLNELEQHKSKIFYETYKKIIVDDLYYKIATILYHSNDFEFQNINIENRNAIFEQLFCINKEIINYYLYNFSSIALVVSKDNKDGYIM